MSKSKRASASTAKPIFKSTHGAAACIKALQSAEQITSRPFTADELFNMDRHYADYEAIKVAFLTAAGPLPAYLQGFVEAMAEYVHFIMTTGEPDLNIWKPEACMSKAQIQASRVKMTKAVNDMAREGESA